MQAVIGIQTCPVRSMFVFMVNIFPMAMSMSVRQRQVRVGVGMEPGGRP